MSQAQIAEQEWTEHVRQTIASTFQLTIEDVPTEAKQGELQGWDSLGQLNLIMELESRFNVSFTTDQVLAMRSVMAIVDILKEQLDGS